MACGPTCRWALCPRLSRRSRCPTSISGVQAFATTASSQVGRIPPKTTKSGESCASSGPSTAWSGTARRRWRSGTGKPGMKQISATGKEPLRSSTNSTTTPSQASYGRCPPLASAAPTPPGGVVSLPAASTNTISAARTTPPASEAHGSTSWPSTPKGAHNGKVISFAWASPTSSAKSIAASNSWPRFPN